MDQDISEALPKIPAGALDKPSGEPLEDIFFATNKLRHSAVHRLPTSARGIHKLIHSVLRLAKVLGDFSRAALLEDLHLEIERRIRDMELNKNFLEERLDKQLHAIQEQRAELDRKEQEAIATMLREDQENKLLIGSFLEASIKNASEVKDKVPVESLQEVNRTDAEVNGDNSRHDDEAGEGLEIEQEGGGEPGE